MFLLFYDGVGLLDEPPPLFPVSVSLSNPNPNGMCVSIVASCGCSEMICDGRMRMGRAIVSLLLVCPVHFLVFAFGDDLRWAYEDRPSNRRAITRVPCALPLSLIATHGFVSLWVHCFATCSEPPNTLVHDGGNQ